VPAGAESTNLPVVAPQQMMESVFPVRHPEAIIKRRIHGAHMGRCLLLLPPRLAISHGTQNWPTLAVTLSGGILCLGKRGEYGW
jgi:hypothetical protein